MGFEPQIPSSQNKRSTSLVRNMFHEFMHPPHHFKNRRHVFLFNFRGRVNAEYDFASGRTKYSGQELDVAVGIARLAKGITDL